MASVVVVDSATIVVVAETVVVVDVDDTFVVVDGSTVVDVDGAVDVELTDARMVSAGAVSGADDEHPATTAMIAKPHPVCRILQR